MDYVHPRPKQLIMCTVSSKEISRKTWKFHKHRFPLHSYLNKHDLHQGQGKMVAECLANDGLR